MPQAHRLRHVRVAGRECGGGIVRCVIARGQPYADFPPPASPRVDSESGFCSLGCCKLTLVVTRVVVDMDERYAIQYRRPYTGVAGLVILLGESDIAAEKAKLESQGFVVTKVVRPVGART